MKLRDRVVWITGASSGIGEHLAYRMAKRGAKLILSARRAPELERVRQGCEDPSRVLALPMDLMEVERFSALAQTATDAFGPIDVLVHNAGVTQRGLAAETSLETVRRIMELNFFAVVALTGELLPSMLERGRGQVAVVSSLAGHVGTPRRSTYSASKHALQGYFDSMRAELHPRGVQVTMLCPGFIDTELTKSALTADGSRYTGDTAKKNAMSPERCAKEMVQAIEGDENERFIGGKELAARWVKRVSPDLLAVLVRKLKSS